ncbi:MAG: molybdopterin cofactor-binding domain-containing protein [Caldilineales bacterium]
MALKKTTIVGQSFPRVESNAKVTGTALYVDDMQFGQNLLYGRLKRSPIPHGFIRRIDTSKARALTGVRVVVTGQDYPGLTGLYLSDRPTFAVDRVRFVGEPVAGVAAETPELAERACELIEVEYEELPGVFDPEYDASPEAPLLHPDLESYACAPFIFRQPGTNVSNWFKVRKGDMDSGWAEADHIYEHTYRVPHVQHVPLETHAAVGQVDGNGRITLWSASQSPFAQRNLIAKSLGISHSKLRVITPYLGGGFGAKAGVSMEGACVILALNAKGRPVKLVMSREEEFYTTFVRQGLVAKIKLGMTRRRPHHRHAQHLLLTRAHNRIRRQHHPFAGCFHRAVLSPTSTPICSVSTRTTPSAGQRSFGMPEIHWAIEQHIDRTAANRVKSGAGAPAKLPFMTAVRRSPA